MAAEHGGSPLSHVIDSSTIELPFFRAIHLPELVLGSYHFQITRFMVMEVVVALLVAAVMIPLARHLARDGKHVPRGVGMNLFESLLLFVRDGIARPSIGGHDADRFLPFLWTLFFFVLFANLLGLVPGGASATGNINVTGVLALLTLSTVILAGMKQMGPVGFWLGLVPHLDVPGWLKPALWLLMLVIEVSGLFIKHIVLAIRLFANMLAGHIVLSVILGFILQALGTWLILVVAPASIAGALGLYFLELLVAVLQAYIITFLSALFIGAAVHPH
jgi:F-type H+-transporting ATPase subunit a